jgi:hypothetical protein
MTKTSLKQMLDRYAATTDRVWEHDRTSTEGASGIFQCSRKRWFAQNETPNDPDYTDRYGARKRGNLIEEYWVIPAVRRGLPDRCSLLWAGEDQRTLVDGYISATPDGLIVNRGTESVDIEGITVAPGACVVLEVKSIDPRVDLKEAKAEHVGQVHVQMGLIRQCTVYQPDWAIPVYVDASFLDTVSVFPTRFDPGVYQAARDRAKQIMLAESPLALAPEGKIAGGKECGYCPYQGRCQGATVTGIPRDEAPLGENVLATLAGLVAERQQAKLEIDAAEKSAGLIEHEIKELLRVHQTRKASGDGWSVTWFPVKGRKSFDRKAAEEAGLDLSRFDREGEPAERLTIKTA